MCNIVVKLISMPQCSGVNLFIYGSLAFDYSTLDKNKCTVMPIFFGTIQRDKDNGALTDSLGGLIMSGR